MGPTWGAEEEQGGQDGVTLLQLRTKGRRSLHGKGVRRRVGNPGRETHPSLGPVPPDDLSALASDA